MVERPHLSRRMAAQKGGGTATYLMIAVLVIASVVAAAVLLIPGENSEEDLPVLRKASDFTLVNQDNQNVTLSEYRGRTVVMCFIYTRCTMSRMCPLTTQKFRTIQYGLSENARNETMLLSVSFDVAYDTPERLREYGEAHGADFACWQFLTGDNETIEKVMNDYNVYYNRTENDTFRHTMLAVLIDGNGYVRREYYGTAWEAEAVKSDIIEVM